MIELFKAAQKAGVPILVVRTADQAATVETMAGAVLDGDQRPQVVWDAALGLHPLTTEKGPNKAGAVALKTVKASETVGFVDAMLAAQALPQGSVLYALNAHRQLASTEPIGVAAAVQSVANLRDQFKRNYRMLVLLGPGFLLPTELEQDVVVIDHALPGPDELKAIVTDLFAAARKSAPKIPAPTPEVLSKAVEALSGLSAFAAEQQTAMSFSDTALNQEALWERKRVAIEQTRGLRVWRGTERFADLVGLDNVKARLARRKTARTPVGVVLFLDEIDKVMANVEHDTSGVRMDQLRTLLTEMENQEWRGLLAVGVAGAGKSAIAKAFGNEAGVPTVALDLGDMEGSLVGESEAHLRRAMAIIKAVGRGHAFVIATSNNASVMRPELQRRFTEGIFFFDVMSPEERAACWTAYIRKYDIPKQPRPADDGWTGAEIRNCCFTPDHTLLGEDLRWRRADAYSVGDTILGFDETGPWRKYRPAIIERMVFEEEQILDVELVSGRVFRLTPDHRVLRASMPRGKAMRWKRADKLNKSDWLPKLLNTWTDDASRDGGWFAGILDGEGSYDRGTISVGQNPGVVLDRIELLARRLGLAYTRRDAHGFGKKCQALRFTGGLAATCELLGKIRPERLVSKLRLDDFGRMEARLGFDRVKRVAAAGTATVAKIRTSTGTLVIDGYPHHNCREAWDTGCTLVEAARHIVPMSQARADEIEKLRRHANGRFLDATKPGVYQYSAEPMRRMVRQLNIGEAVVAAVPVDDLVRMEES